MRLQGKGTLKERKKPERDDQHPSGLTPVDSGMEMEFRQERERVKDSKRVGRDASAMLERGKLQPGVAGLQTVKAV